MKTRVEMHSPPRRQEPMDKDIKLCLIICATIIIGLLGSLYIGYHH